MTAPTITLPPPTSLDLSVVRARLELRELRVPGVAYRWWTTRAARTLILLLVGFIPLIAAGALLGTGHGGAWVAAAGTGVSALAAVVFLSDSRRIRKGDERIIRAAGVGTAVDRLKDRPARTTAGVVLASLNVLLGIGYGGWMTLSRPSAAALVTILGQVAVGALFAATLRPMLAPTAAWDGAVLDAVDTALRRSDVARVLPVCALAALPIPLAVQASGDLLTPPPVLPIAVMLVARWLVHPRGIEDPLLRDPRLSSAPPAARWLDGAAA